MRTQQEMFDLIINTAKSDERIRASLLVGSRANPTAPKDEYQDYDVCYFVTDMKPFFDNPSWIEEHFGKPLIMQTPETMRGADGGGHFTYLMIFPDGNRIDLTFNYTKYIDNGEPAITLLDKDNDCGFLPTLPPPNGVFWNIKPPTSLCFYSC